MKIFKFGGASVNSVERIKQMAEILLLYKDEKKLVVISAMGKTTNALEKVAGAFFNGEKEMALELFNHIKNQHITTARYLLITHYNTTFEHLSQLFTEVEWTLHDTPVKEYDYYYDQIVCLGELLSTTIISAYLNEKGVANTWTDVRDIIRTDNTFREAVIDWNTTSGNVQRIIVPLFQKNDMVVTQGFLGATDENESTTLGREGSDYTAAVFANLLQAESATIWKDVEGVMNADPKAFNNAKLIDELNYDEVIEMAYYGAQVIHPKTMRPLQNKNIPLYVKCFLDPALPGTVIHNKVLKHLPPIIVVKNNLVLLHFHSTDFSFIGERKMSRLYQLFAEHKVRPGLIQTGAVSLMACIEERDDRAERLAGDAATIFDVQMEKGLTLLTIRYYTSEVVEELTAGKSVVLRQQTKDTIQMLIK